MPTRWNARAPLRALGGRARAAWRADRARATVFALACAWLLGGALLVPPRSRGDGGEYLLMAESLLRHGSPDVRPADVQALAAHERRAAAGVNFAATLHAYFEAHDGRFYSYHFWGYALLTLPARLALGLLGLDALKAPQAANALILLLALHQVLYAAALPRRAALLLALLALFSPAAWFVMWPHPETATFSFVLLALVWTHAGRRRAAVLAGALAAMQNPPLVFLLLPLWLRALVQPRARRLPDVAWACAAALPAALPPLFFLWKFGTPSVIARESTRLELLSAGRALDLFLDLNLGLVAYMPVALVLFAAALLLALAGRRRVFGAATWLAVLALAALACTVTGHWNHGTSGPSRYAVWLAALVLYAVAEGDGWAAALRLAWARRAWAAAAALAVASQAAIVAARGGLAQEEDFLAHSWAARLVLRHAPALYEPEPEVFVSRTLGLPVPEADQPAVHADDGGCRKGWLRPEDEALVVATCGRVPQRARAFFAQTTRRRAWSYVDLSHVQVTREPPEGQAHE